MPNADEPAFGLYALSTITLKQLPADANTSDFWDALAEKAAQSDHDGVSIRITLLSSRIVRVERTMAAVPIAIHMAIYEQRTAAGVSIKVQPLMGWRRAFGGGAGAEPMQAAIAESTVTALRTELRDLAAGIP